MGLIGYQVVVDGPGQVAQRADAQHTDRRRDRDEPEEDPAPPEGVRHERGREGRDQRRQHPRGRHHGEHAGPERFGKPTPDADVRHRDHGPTAEALERPTRHQHPHARGHTADRQAGTEQGEPAHERHQQRHPVRGPTTDDRPDDVTERERGERPPVQVDVAELVLDGRHDRDDGHGLDGHDGDEADDADQAQPVTGIPEAARRRRWRRHVGTGRIRPYLLTDSVNPCLPTDSVSPGLLTDSVSPGLLTDSVSPCLLTDSVSPCSRRRSPS